MEGAFRHGYCVKTDCRMELCSSILFSRLKVVLKLLLGHIAKDLRVGNQPFVGAF